MLLKFSVCFKVNMWFSMLVAFVMWPLVAFHAPLSILLADGCIFGATEELKELQKPNITANVANACLTKASLLKAFDIESELNFTNVIDTSFIDNYDFAALMNFTDLNTITADVNVLTAFGDFNVSLSPILTDVDCVNERIDAATCCFSYKNLSSLVFSSLTGGSQAAINADCCTAGTNCYANVLGRAEDYKVLEATVIEMQQNVTALNNINDQIRDTLKYQQELVKNSTKLIDPFLDVGEELKSAATCGFIGDGYKSFKSFMCSKLVKHLYILGLSLGICAGCAWLSICCSMCNHNRWAWQKKDKKEDDEYTDDEYLAAESVDNSRRSSRTDRKSLEMTKPPTYAQSKVAPEDAFNTEEGQTSKRSGRRRSGSSSYRGKTNITFKKK